jgi:iron complex outermembrane receptor protein
MFVSKVWNAIPVARFVEFLACCWCRIALIVLCIAALPVLDAQAFAQNIPAAGPQQAQPDQDSPTKQQKVTPVSTTVVVHGDLNSEYLPQSVTVGTLDGQPLKNAPLSATVISRDLMNNKVARLLSDVVKNDASVEDDYVPVGYYGVYQIRGFPIDLATGLEINGMTIAGEQDVPLENKQSVEILNGLAGVESGVAAGGGLINFVTKVPTLVHDLDVATDQFGTAYGATDLGRFFGGRKQVGMWLNLAAERIETYMDGTAGWRAVGAGAASWNISQKALLEGNFEYQHKTEADGSGYQLLGGTTLPDIHRISRSTMLGEQAWAPPDTYDVFNTNTRLNLNLSPKWTAFAEASLSHSLIQDNVIYAYGPALDPATYAPACPNAPDAPAYFFCPDGTYGIYDYRNPNELRIDGVAQAMTTGQVKTGAVTQVITFGGELFLRSVQMPGYYSVDNPASPDGVVQDGAVYAYVGSENIYKPNAPVAWGTPDSLEYPIQAAGPRRLWQDSHQSSLVLQDRVQLPGRVQLIAGGRYDALRDHNYSVQAAHPYAPVARTDKPVWLPQYAAAFNPVQSLTLYANYGVVLSLGPQGPWWVDNANDFLAPYNTRQFEAGAKYQPGQRILLSGDFFHMRAPFFYPKAIQAPDSFCPANVFQGPVDMCFEQQGRETHNGFELNAQGKVSSGIRLSASMAEIHAISRNTGTPAFDNKQVINVPRVRTAVFADVRVPHFPGLYLMPGWGYTSTKEALRDDTVSVPGYNLFNLGARYTPGGEQGRISFRVYCSNVTNKKYWSDTGASYGDTFIWLGAPAWVRMAAHYTF